MTPLIIRVRPNRPLPLEILTKPDWVGRLMAIEWCIVYHRWMPTVGHHLSRWIARSHHEKKYGPMENG